MKLNCIACTPLKGTHTAACERKCTFSRRHSEMGDLNAGLPTSPTPVHASVSYYLSRWNQPFSIARRLTSNCARPLTWKKATSYTGCLLCNMRSKNTFHVSLLGRCTRLQQLCCPQEKASHVFMRIGSLIRIKDRPDRSDPH